MSDSLALLHKRSETMTKSEKRIYNYIISNTREMLKQTISELASLCNVSDATIVRFFQKLKYESFQEFKLTLASQIENNNDEKDLEDQDLTINENDSEELILNKIGKNCINAIENTLSIVSIDDYIKAANMIRAASKILIFGVGSSSAIADILEYKLIRLGYPAFSFKDPHMQAFSAANLKSTDVVIGVSNSGSTKDTLDSLKVGKSHNASSICITEHLNSPITKYADIILETSSGDNHLKSGAGRSILAQAFTVEYLTALLFSMDRAKSIEAGKETAKAVINKLY
ncbi:MAG: hypothetical protein PWQ77_2124 [Kosmotogales bacterium]|nr:hypothetical protein [Kosmotogales bacterium]